MIESPAFRDVPEQEVQGERFKQLNRLIRMDMAMSEYLSGLNGMEVPMPQDWIDAASETRNTIRHGIFFMLTELGDSELGRLGRATSQLGRLYQSGNTESVMLGGSATEAHKEVAKHIIFLQGNEYQREYID